jgi:hypothetical protein
MAIDKINILQVFTAGTDEGREWMRKPFTTERGTGATDGHALILIEDLLEGVDPYPGPENTLDSIIPQENIKINFTIHQIRQAIGKASLIDETTYLGEDKECGACKGEGEVGWEFYYKGKTHYEDHDCPVCWGDGKESIAKKVPTGKKIRDPEAIIQFIDSRIALKYVENLIRVAEYEQTERVSLVSQIDPLKGNLFKVNQTIVLIMPLSPNDYDVVVHHFI